LIAGHATPDGAWLTVRWITHRALIEKHDPSDILTWRRRILDRSFKFLDIIPLLVSPTATTFSDFNSFLCA
jgi:hypothetical protein